MVKGYTSSADVSRHENLVSIAFDKAWRFIEKDPFLAHNSEALLRARLRTHLELLVKNGNDDILDLANKAISNLRAELSRVPEC